MKYRKGFVANSSSQDYVVSSSDNLSSESSSDSQPGGNDWLLLKMLAPGPKNWNVYGYRDRENSQTIYLVCWGAGRETHSQVKIFKREYLGDTWLDKKLIEKRRKGYTHILDCPWNWAPTQRQRENILHQMHKKMPQAAMPKQSSTPRLSLAAQALKDIL